jgi:DNA polymerase III epsilon subunit-like protein
MSRFLIFDTETTGFPLDRRAPYTNARNWPRVVQLAWAVVGEDGREAAAEEHLIRPEGFSIPADAVRVHGITTERARAEGLPLADALGRFLAALDGEADSVALVAHNLDFDRNGLAAELHRVGHARPDIEQALFQKPAHCTMQEATAYCRIPGARGRFKWPTLEQLHRKLFGKGIEGAHTALADVRACARCFFRLRELGVMG